MKKTVKFNAHKVEKVPTKVKFTTNKGEKVVFEAEKKQRIPVKVKFEADA